MFEPPVHNSGSSLVVCWCADGDDKSVVPAEWMIKKMESDDELVRFMELVLQGYFEVRKKFSLREITLFSVLLWWNVSG